MGSLRVLTSLLGLLVLVPAAALAWLAIDQEARLDAAVGRLIEQDYDLAELDVRRALPTAVWWAEDALRLRLERCAALLRERPDDLPTAWEEIRSSLEQDAEEVRLVDSAGRTILPAPFVPNDAPPGSRTAAEVLEGLRRRADRALFGHGDLDAALAVLETARGGLPSPVYRAAIDVESARLRTRSPRAPASPAEEVRRLRRAVSDDLLARVGRPTVLLLLDAAPLDDSARQLLTKTAGGYSTEALPLTESERARVDQALGRPPPKRTEGAIVRSAEVAHGARLEARFATTPDSTLWRGLLRHLRGGEVGVPHAVRADVSLWPTARIAAGVRDPDPRTFEMEGIDGRPFVVRLVHEQADGLREAKRARRVWVTVGIASLLCVLAVGLVLVRRAVAKERAARRAKDEFVANVSHELRTPLTSVLLHAEMLAEGGLSEERRRALVGVVRGEGGRLAGLVEDLLDLAALERGARRLEPEPIDLAAAARAAAQPFRAPAEAEGVELTVEGPEVAALADPRAVSRILANLVANAWRHGRPSRGGGPGRLRVSTYDAGGPGVEVRDDGPGIPEGLRVTLFERFRRGASAAGARGFGLGLALSRELAREMGGDLVLVDDAQETVFRLTLPPVPEPVP